MCPPALTTLRLQHIPHVQGATNRPFDLDEAVLRRFTHRQAHLANTWSQWGCMARFCGCHAKMRSRSRCLPCLAPPSLFAPTRIFVGLPDRAARQSILEVVLEGESLAADLDLSRLAELTEGYSGSDLKQLCVQAAMRPVRAFLEQDSATAAAAEAAAATAREEAAARVAAAAAQAEEEIEAEGGGGEGRGNSKLHSVPEADGASAGTSAAGSAAAAPPVSLPLVPRLDSLLRQAERIASRPSNPRTDLRPISMRVGGLRCCCGGAVGGRTVCVWPCFARLWLAALLAGMAGHRRGVCCVSVQPQQHPLPSNSPLPAPPTQPWVSRTVRRR